MTAPWAILIEGYPAPVRGSAEEILQRVKFCANSHLRFQLQRTHAFGEVEIAGWTPQKFSWTRTFLLVCDWRRIAGHWETCMRSDWCLRPGQHEGKCWPTEVEAE